MCSEHPQYMQSMGTVAKDVAHMLRCRQSIGDCDAEDFQAGDSSDIG